MSGCPNISGPESAWICSPSPPYVSNIMDTVVPISGPNRCETIATVAPLMPNEPDAVHTRPSAECCHARRASGMSAPSARSLRATAATHVAGSSPRTPARKSTPTPEQLAATILPLL
jgi:hypothetical protein